MFPSLGLLSQIDCPHRDRCQRGTLCLFAHDRFRPRKLSTSERSQSALVGSTEIWLEEPDSEIQTKQSEPTPAGDANTLLPESDAESKDIGARQALERALAEFRPPAITQSPEKSPHSEDAQITLVDNERGSISAKNSTSVDDWRQHTLNYDRSGPAYDPATESRVVQPQLKAVVGKKVGYAKRQRALETLFRYLTDIHAADSSEKPWIPAMHAVRSEAELYSASVAGTYHGKLLTRIRELKQQAAKPL
ncbi:hypothetical protein H4S08_001446 [Coemansia sp. RSA 1365]|nr:hypothetical protein H4S08_001446 [Coemansia sp. RSA 1365]